MGGSSAAGGFSYQHARTVLDLLVLVKEPNLSSLRIEAANDVIDVEIFDEENLLVKASQYKRRNHSYTWGATELINELSRWCSIAEDSPKATYQFVTDGRLGPSGRKVQEALDELRLGDNAKFNSIVSKGALSEDDCKRARIISNTSDVTATLEESIQVARNLLPNVTSNDEAEARSAWVVLSLLREVVEKSGENDPHNRLITRAEVVAILADDRDFVAGADWSNRIKSDYIRSVLQTGTHYAELLCSYSSPYQESKSKISLGNLLSQETLVLLTGSTGSGKSTAIENLQKDAAARGQVAIAINAEMYLEGRLAALVSKGINARTYIGAYPATGIKALQDPSIILIIDNVSEIPQKLQDSLKKDLRELLASQMHTRILLCGRDYVKVKSLLPRDAEYTSTQIEPLDRARRVEIASRKFSTGTLTGVVAQTERALGDAAGNPQFFIMGCSLILEGHRFTDPASMYARYVNKLLEESGIGQTSIYEAALGVAFAILAEQESRSTDSLNWSQVLSKSIEKLHLDDDEITLEDLKRIGFESGLVKRGSGDIVHALHDSFADYLAAVALHRGLVELPEILNPDYSTLIIFLAELKGVDYNFATLVARDLPFSTPKIAQWEAQTWAQSWNDEAYNILRFLAPADNPLPKLAMSVVDGQAYITLDGDVEGWQGETTVEILLESGGKIFLAENGPLTIAIKAWRYVLNKRTVEWEKYLRSALPKTIEETRELLNSYATSFSTAIADLIENLSPMGQKEILSKAVTVKYIQFFLSLEPVPLERDRRVSFQYSDEVQSPLVVDGLTYASLSPRQDQRGFGTVDSFISKSPIEEAYREITRTINQLSGLKWL